MPVSLFFMVIAMSFNYKSTAWQKKRAHILRRDKYLCKESLRYGKRVNAEIVHHIYPVKDYPQYAFCDWNLISLSNAMHEKMHHRETGELTALGKQLQRRHPIPQHNAS